MPRNINFIKILKILLLISIIVFLIITFIFDLHSVNQSVCLFKNLTGYNCLMCNMTKSTSLILDGNFIEALKYHNISLFIFILLLITLVYLISDLFGIVKTNILKIILYNYLKIILILLVTNYLFINLFFIF